MHRFWLGLRRGLASRLPGISSPPAEAARTDAHSTAGYSGREGWVFRLGDLGWLLGGWMRHQRCAGCLGGKAEFPCGLAGVDVGLWDNFWNSFG